MPFAYYYSIDAMRWSSLSNLQNENKNSTRLMLFCIEQGCGTHVCAAFAQSGSPWASVRIINSHIFVSVIATHRTLNNIQLVDVTIAERHQRLQ